MPLDQVKRVLLVLSGKGGVGKSTVAVQLALSLVARRKRVGLLDIDLCGPSLPRMLGVEGADVLQGVDGWIPVSVPQAMPTGVPTESDAPEASNEGGEIPDSIPDDEIPEAERDSQPGLWIMSIGFLQRSPRDAVIWRGPKKNAMIQQFTTGVAWPPHLDFLIIDTPPGTSDEHLSIVESLRNVNHEPDGAILVTTPQGVAVADVRREVTFCRRGNVPMMGIIENMSGYVCPHCAECSNVFSRGGGRNLAAHAGIPFLAEIPIDPQLTRCADNGENYVKQFSESVACQRFADIAEKLLDETSYSSS